MSALTLADLGQLSALFAIFVWIESLVLAAVLKSGYTVSSASSLFGSIIFLAPKY